LTGVKVINTGKKYLTSTRELWNLNNKKKLKKIIDKVLSYAKADETQGFGSLEKNR